MGTSYQSALMGQEGDTCFSVILILIIYYRAYSALFVFILGMEWKVSHIRDLGWASKAARYMTRFFTGGGDLDNQWHLYIFRFSDGVLGNGYANQGVLSRFVDES